MSKSDVDKLREELGQPPLPSLQHTLDEKSSKYVINYFLFHCVWWRVFFESGTVVILFFKKLGTAGVASRYRKNNDSRARCRHSGLKRLIDGYVRYLHERRMNGTSNTNNGTPSSKRSGDDLQAETGKRPRGRPKGSKNRTKD